MPALPKDIQAIAEHVLEKSFGKTALRGYTPVAGGCINNGGKIETSAGEFFIKWNESKTLRRMFETEARGLTLLQQAKAIRIPTVIGYSSDELYQIIILEFIDGEKGKNYWVELGEKLAVLHKHSQKEFGLDHHNYIGSLPQYNSEHSSWIDFFIEQRLEVQLKMAVDDGRADSSVSRRFHNLYKALPSIMPVEKPALLHGDLWVNNLTADGSGSPCLIDPAVYFGHREAEIAYTQLFERFDKEFYTSYHGHYPLQPAFEERVDIYNLYPLLVHVNLFGGGYIDQVKTILRPFN